MPCPKIRADHVWIIPIFASCFPAVGFQKHWDKYALGGTRGAASPGWPILAASEHIVSLICEGLRAAARRENPVP